MKMTLESTPRIVDLNGQPSRMWLGATEKGVPVTAYIRAIAVPEGRPAADYAEFERDTLQALERRQTPLQDAILAAALAMGLTGAQLTDQLGHLLAAVICTYAESPEAARVRGETVAETLTAVIERTLADMAVDRLEGSDVRH